MASCVTNIYTKNYQNPIIGFQVTVQNVWDGFFWHTVYIQSKPSKNNRKEDITYINQR